MNSATSTGYPTPPALNLAQRQVMLSFAYLAYSGEGLTTTDPQSTILANINAAIPQIPVLAASGWKVAWGPAVYTVPGSLYQDNMMYVAQNDTVPGQCVIAIRGTNFISEVDWLFEDFNVSDMMNWPIGASSPNPPGAMIAESTSIDLNILLNMKDTLLTQQTLFQFLSAQSTSALNICVTGHSLGGVLAGTLALYLLENMALPNGWDQSGQSTVSFISFAAPTAGNSQFAQYSDTAFAGATRPPSAIWDAGLNTNADVVECAYDIAPLFYTASNIYANGAAGPVFSTYGANIDFGSLKGDLDIEKLEWGTFQSMVLSRLATLTANCNYTQLATANAGGPIPGVFNGVPASDDDFSDYLTAFLEQAVWQHSNSYPNIFGLDATLLNPAIIVRNVLSLTSISPNSVHIEDTLTVTFTGTCFSTLLNPVINAGSNIVVSELTVVSDTEITATLHFTPLSVGTNQISISGNSGASCISTSTMPITVHL